MWFGMNTDAVIKDEMHDTVMYARIAAAHDQDQTGDDQQKDPVQRQQEAVDLGLLRALEQIADPVVAKRDPVERRERPERPPLDPQEKASERGAPVRRVRIDGKEDAEVHVGIAPDLLAVEWCSCGATARNRS